ncbi:MAG TPA: iron-containing alcohol dehydrogenase [Pirellulales bacterium]|nr:iron-containing alcohol dehydrogenase [Pirellulales bacterium]
MLFPGVELGICNTPPPFAPALFEHLQPAKIVFGWGRRRELGQHAAAVGRRALIVTGSRALERTGTYTELAAILAEHAMEAIPLAEIHREPLVADVDQAVAAARRRTLEPGDFVLAIGGGSALDLGKAVAGLAPNHEGNSVADYLEGVGRNLALTQPPLPLVAMPTTAGTGSEATKNAVISSHEPAYKKSLRAAALIPRLVLIDPELTVGVPSDVTAHTGMDAITQLIESYLSCRAQPFTRALALDGLRYALPAIRDAVREGSARPPREAMAYAALLSGIALANSGLGLAHGVAAALGVQANVAHGLACAMMLPPALQANRAACEGEYATLARCIPGSIPEGAGRQADFFVEWIAALVDDLKIPRRLSDLGVRREQLPALVAGSHGNSLNGNPRPIGDLELARMLESLL